MIEFFREKNNALRLGYPALCRLNIGRRPCRRKKRPVFRLRHCAGLDLETNPRGPYSSCMILVVAPGASAKPAGKNEGGAV
jgi:hypothetical protein